MPSLVQCAVQDERVERETGFEPATPSLEGWRSTAELFPPVLPARSMSINRNAAHKWWGEEDLNLRRRSPADLQSAPFDRLGISPLIPQVVTPCVVTPRNVWRWREDLNPRPTAYKAVALPLSYASSRKTSL